MRLHVAFHPSLLATGAPWEAPRPDQRAAPPPADRPQVCLVVDVLRASTTLVTLVERGAGTIYIAPSVEAARASAAARAGAVMAGELEGLAPPGFDYGNSPVEASRAEVAGRSVVFVTTNGTAAIRAVHRLGPVLIGALRNADAAAGEALAVARAEERDLTVVCAGREGAFGIDDAYCAGALVDRILHHAGARQDLQLTDGATAAHHLYRTEPDARALFTRAAAGQNVIRLGLAGDVEYCAQADVTTIVPRLERELQMLDEGG